MRWIGLAVAISLRVAPSAATSAAPFETSPVALRHSVERILKVVLCIHNMKRVKQDLQEHDLQCGL